MHKQNTASFKSTVLEKLDRKGRVNADGSITYSDGLPAPSEQEWDAAEAAVMSRKSLSREKFAQLFTDEEKHEIKRRAAQSAATRANARVYAALDMRFSSRPIFRSDSTELAQALAFLESDGVLTSSRRARIASFLSPLT